MLIFREKSKDDFTDNLWIFVLFCILLVSLYLISAGSRPYFASTPFTSYPSPFSENNDVVILAGCTYVLHRLRKMTYRSSYCCIFLWHDHIWHVVCSIVTTYNSLIIITWALFHWYNWNFFWYLRLCFIYVLFWVGIWPAFCKTTIYCLYS